MYKCESCRSVFEEPAKKTARYGGFFEASGFEPFAVCPCCESTDITEVVECSECGRLIDKSYKDEYAELDFTKAHGDYVTGRNQYYGEIICKDCAFAFGVQGSPKYAPLEDTLADYVRPICTKYGIAIFQSLITNENKQAGVSTTLLHESGQFIESDYVFCDVVLPLSKQGNKVLTEGQATGVCITYLRRYSLNAALGITGDKDTDGSYADREPLTYETALEYEITFGKYKGKTLKEIFNTDMDYINWLSAKADDEVKEAISLIKSHDESTPNEEPEITYPKIFCPECGVQMLKMVTPKGNIWTPEQIIAKYGMCEDCYKKERLTKAIPNEKDV
ncbi:MAG: ERF family protein [Ruminococcus sp.]|nr:ERF family protein [Ruminococcus sp.]